MRTYFGTFRTASAITKQAAERFKLQTANSTRQIRRIIFPTSAFAPSAPCEIGEFSSAFSGAIASIRQDQPPLNLTHVFWEGTNRRPPRRLIQPLGIDGNLWSRSTSTSTSSRCPRYRTCCAWRLPCARSRAGGRGSTRTAPGVPRSRRGGRRSAMP